MMRLLPVVASERGRRDVLHRPLALTELARCCPLISRLADRRRQRVEIRRVARKRRRLVVVALMLGALFASPAAAFADVVYPGGCEQYSTSGFWYNFCWVGYGYEQNGDFTVAMQRELNGLGYSAGSVDGYFGPNTNNGLVNYQISRGLAGDGIAGNNTWNKLKADLFWCGGDNYTSGSMPCGHIFYYGYGTYRWHVLIAPGSCWQPMRIAGPSQIC